MTATVKRDVQTNFPASLTRSMAQTWVRPPKCTGRAVPVTSPARAALTWFALISWPTHWYSLGVDAHHCARAAQGFGERHRCAAVKQSIGLPRSPVDGHGAADEIAADFGELDSKVLDQSSAAAGIQFLYDSRLRQAIIWVP